MRRPCSPLMLTGAMLTGILSCFSPPAVAQWAPPPPPPGPRLAWQRGSWEWDGRAYGWQPGHYVGWRPGYHEWVPGHWSRRRFERVWIPAHWR